MLSLLTMRILRTLLFLLTLFVSFGKVEAQSKYPKNYFRSPVEFKILLAGSFGEARKNHFHSGIDIRTEGVTGKPVHAVADGYISRINISSTGFGKALYITHPNGYTTVYGHLEGFNAKIGNWIRSQQYKQESFEVDIPLQPDILPVKKGDIIAYSGNTGASGGPHLHFEVRDAATQDAINPLLFGMPVVDDVLPKIYSIKIYPQGENSLVNFSNNPVSFTASERTSARSAQMISKAQTPRTRSGAGFCAGDGGSESSGCSAEAGEDARVTGDADSTAT